MEKKQSSAETQREQDGRWGAEGAKGLCAKRSSWGSCGKPDGVTSVSHAAQTNRSGSRRVKTVRTEEEF